MSRARTYSLTLALIASLAAGGYFFARTRTLTRQNAALQAKLDDAREKADDVRDAASELQDNLGELDSEIGRFDYDDWKGVVPDVRDKASEASDSSDRVKDMTDDLYETVGGNPLLPPLPRIPHPRPK